jgi:AP-3 complex subunit mu
MQQTNGATAPPHTPILPDPPPPPPRPSPRRQHDALGVVEFLHRLFDTFCEYFGEVTPRALTDNFSIAYQLCEEMLDNGHPMITELNALTSLIAPPSMVGRMASFIVGKSSGVSDTLGEGAMSIIPWRRSGVKYAQNEITFDIVEEVDAIYERCGPTTPRRTGLRPTCPRAAGPPPPPPPAPPSSAATARW